MGGRFHFRPHCRDHQAGAALLHVGLSCSGSYWSFWQRLRSEEKESCSTARNQGDQHIRPGFHHCFPDPFRFLHRPRVSGLALSILCGAWHQHFQPAFLAELLFEILPLGRGVLHCPTFSRHSHGFIQGSKAGSLKRSSAEPETLPGFVEAVSSGIDGDYTTLV